MRVYVHSLVIAFGCVFACSAGRAFAQTVTNPQFVEFDPSPDHWAVDATGRPIVDHYELVVLPAGGSIPYEIVLLGKPTPQTDGKIRLSLLTALTTPPQPLVIYEAQVTAVGPTGSSASNLSNAFVFSGPCSYAVAASNQTFTAAGGSGTLSVTTGTGCVWSAGSLAEWVSVGSPGGTGSGSVAFAVAPNPSAGSRAATIDIAFQSLTVTETGSTTCSLTVSPSSAAFPAVGGSGIISVTAPNGCAWTPVSGASWLRLGSGGIGSGTFAFTVAPNMTVSNRSAVVAVGNQTIAVTQAGAVCSSVSMSVSSTAFPAAGGSGTISVKAAKGCAWTTKSSATWLALGASGGSGNGRVAFTVAANRSSQSRSASISLGKQSVTVTQAGVGCNVSISSSVRTFSSAAGTGRIEVQTPHGCAWTPLSTAPWLTTASGGVGSGSAAFAVAANPSSLGRSVSITIGAQSITIAQSGVACTVSISSSSQSFPSAGGSGIVNVTAPEGCAWTPRSSADWLTAGSGGTGNGSVGFTVAANPTTGIRSASLTIANRSITVTEAGSSSSSSVSLPPSRQAIWGWGGHGAVTVTARGTLFTVTRAAPLTPTP